MRRRLAVLLFVLAAMPGRAETPRRPRLGTVPHSAFRWEPSLAPLFRLPLTSGAQKRIVLVDPVNTSLEATIVLEVTAHAIGEFSRSCTPQLAILVTEHFPPGTPEKRCHALVVGPQFAEETVEWDREDGVFTDQAWACADPMAVRTDRWTGLDMVHVEACVQDRYQGAVWRRATLQFDGILVAEESDASAGICQAGRSGLRLTRDRAGNVAGAVGVRLRGGELRRYLEVLASKHHLQSLALASTGLRLSSSVEADVRHAQIALENDHVTFAIGRSGGEETTPEGEPVGWWIDVPLN